MDDHGVELVVMRTWINAVTFQLESRDYFYLCVVFGEIIVKSFEGKDED